MVVATADRRSSRTRTDSTSGERHLALYRPVQPLRLIRSSGHFDATAQSTGVRPVPSLSTPGRPGPGLKVVSIDWAGRPGRPERGVDRARAVHPSGGGRACPDPSLAPVRALARVRPPSGRRLDSAVYRRRRILAGGLVLVAVAAVLVLVQLIQAGIGGGPLATTGAAATGPVPVRASVYVVQPGDTIWSIAASLDPRGDERPLVDQLVKEAGGAGLYPGERLAIPAAS